METGTVVRQGPTTESDTAASLQLADNLPLQQEASELIMEVTQVNEAVVLQPEMIPGERMVTYKGETVPESKLREVCPYMAKLGEAAFKLAVNAHIKAEEQKATKTQNVLAVPQQQKPKSESAITIKQHMGTREQVAEKPHKPAERPAPPEAIMVDQTTPMVDQPRTAAAAKPAVQESRPAPQAPTEKLAFAPELDPPVAIQQSRFETETSPKPENQFTAMPQPVPTAETPAEVVPLTPDSKADTPPQPPAVTAMETPATAAEAPAVITLEDVPAVGSIDEHPAISVIATYGTTDKYELTTPEEVTDRAIEAVTINEEISRKNEASEDESTETEPSILPATEAIPELSISEAAIIDMLEEVASVSVDAESEQTEAIEPLLHRIAELSSPVPEAEQTEAKVTELAVALEELFVAVGLKYDAEQISGIAQLLVRPTPAFLSAAKENDLISYVFSKLGTYEGLHEASHDDPLLQRMTDRLHVALGRFALLTAAAA
jgi:hypothetical protein